MKTNTKKVLGLLSLSLVGLFALMSSNNASAATACLGTGSSCSVPTTLTMTILPGDVCIGSSGSFSFGSYAISSSQQVVTGAFAGTGGYFYVDDLKGANSGYYTTIQMSGDLIGTGGAYIASGNVAMKTSATGSGAITLLAGTANPRVEIHAGMASFQALNAPKILILRSTAANFGVVGKYGVLPQMELTIPAYKSVGTYTGTLVYTLYQY